MLATMFYRRPKAKLFSYLFKQTARECNSAPLLPSCPFALSFACPEQSRRVEGLRKSCERKHTGTHRHPRFSQMSFWVYILRCADNSYYTGHTDDLEVRLAKHASGELGGYTSTRVPVKLLFSEQFPTREETLTCERQIKGWIRKKIEALMRGDWTEVSRLARSGRPSRTSA